MRKNIEERNAIDDAVKFGKLYKSAKEKAETLRKQAAEIEKQDKEKALEYRLKANKIESELVKMQREQAKSNAPRKHKRSLDKFEIKLTMIE